MRRRGEWALKPHSAPDKKREHALMSFDKSELQNIAWLARLVIDEEAMAGYAADLANILTLVEQMNQADTEGVEPLAHPLELQARLRPDAVAEQDQRDDFQAGAPQTAEGYYIVPKVIE